MKWNVISPILTVFCLALLAACTPRISAKAWKTYSPVTAEADFVVFEVTDTIPVTGSERLGQIQLNMKNSDYPAVLDTVIAIARSWGANALKIDRHQQLLDIWLGRPNHQVEATALRLTSVDRYLKHISWSEQRPLTIADFRADTANRPFLAVTSSSIYLYWEMHPAHREVVVQTRAIFNRPLSYFKTRFDSLDILAHEQGHFDIAEIHARKFRQILSGHVFDSKTWSEEIRALHSAALKAEQDDQDHYDHDVYGNSKKQRAWLAQIQSDLAQYANYRENKLVLKLK